MRGTMPPVPAPAAEPGTRTEQDTDRVVPVGFLGTGLHLPPRRVTNDELARTLDTNDAWIRDRLGIRERRFVADGLTTSDMCIDAATSALSDAGLDAADVDALVLATFTPDQPLPSTAVTVAHRIGASRAVPVDLTQAACAGGVLALFVATQLLQLDGIRVVLVVGGDAASRATDPTERTTRVIFGDAAAAAVLGRVPRGHGLLGWDFGSSLSYDISIPAGGSARPASAATVAAREHFVHMDGRVAFQAATTYLPATIRATTRRAGITVDQLDYLALHQANGRIVDSVLAELGILPERSGRTLTTMGNTASASVLTVLHQARQNGLLAQDQLVAVAAIGAGLVWGSLCFRWY